ncbi:MAG TPA: hypothetical protein VK489_09280, partial [Ferruginibacter sp.]|nr:hypothetical protein [Ferruginibacter sp.]
WDNNWNDEFYYDSEEDIRWQADVDYVMKADGLYTLDGRKADGWNDRHSRKERDLRDRSNGDNYRYNEYDRKADSLRSIEEIKRQRKIDSIERAKEKLDSIKEKIESGTVNGEPLSMHITNVYDPMLGIN